MSYYSCRLISFRLHGRAISAVAILLPRLGTILWKSNDPFLKLIGFMAFRFAVRRAGNVLGKS